MTLQKVITQLKSVQAQMLCVKHDQPDQMELLRHVTGWRRDDCKAECQVEEFMGRITCVCYAQAYIHVY